MEISSWELLDQFFFRNPIRYNFYTHNSLIYMHTCLLFFMLIFPLQQFDLKNDSISSRPTISKNSNFLLHDTTTAGLCFRGGGGQLRIAGILCSGEVGVRHSSSVSSNWVERSEDCGELLVVLILIGGNWISGRSNCLNSCRSVDILRRG